MHIRDLAQKEVERTPHAGQRQSSMKGVFVTATDTEVGKTITSCAMALTLANTRVIKPIQTGCLAREEGMYVPDVEMVKSLGGRAEALHCFYPPCSPHLALALAKTHLSCADLASEIRAKAQEEPDSPVIVEGAGGIYVPINENETMLDLMLELDLPVLLVVGNRLGCLNQARLSIETLQLRGLKVVGMVLNRAQSADVCDPGCGSDAGYEDEERILNDNARSLESLGKKCGVPLLADIPYLGGDIASCKDELVSGFAPVAQRVRDLWAAPNETDADLAFDREHLWHPYTSATNPLPVYGVKATRKNRILLEDGKELIDGMSSWWCAVHGYGNENIVRALQAQAARMSHVMFGGLTHRPAVALARRILSLVPEGLTHLFFADSGSVSVEVALKMAVQYQISLGRTKRRHFLTPMGGYHGDTQGAMSVCDPVNGMHTLFTGLLPRHYFMERPTCRFDAPYAPSCLDDARARIASLKDEIAAVILEPVVQGAGGMWFYHPRYLKELQDLCREHDILFIADEIATGFGRTGRLFACQWAGITPDIMCIGKALTGGMMTGAATLATERVARGIGEATPELGGGLLMHGPTFMANPLFCATALASIEELLASPWQERVKNIEALLEKGLAPCRGREGICDVRVLGAIGVVETEHPVDMARLQKFFVEKGVWIRPFGRLVYLMPPLVTPDEDVQRLCAVVVEAVENGLAG